MANSAHSWHSNSIKFKDSSSPTNPKKFDCFKFNSLQLIQRFFRSLVAPSEVQIWLTSDRSGHLSWSAYDPISGGSVSGLSEVEMRDWLETRYYC